MSWDSLRIVMLAVWIFVGVPCAHAHGVGDCRSELGEATAEVELRITEKGSLVFTPEAKQILALLTLEDEDLVPAFERASPRKQHDMIRSQLARRSGSFRANRRIPVVRLRRVVRLRWMQTTKFLGVEYAPFVDHEIDLAPLLGSPAVELGSPAARTIGGFIEIHLRSATLSPGQLERETWTLMDGLGISQHKAHVHVVTPIPKIRLASSAERFGLVNGYRYFNMAAEMISILFKNKSIRTDRRAIWEALYGFSLVDLMNDLERYATDGSMAKPDEYKMSYVGFHFPNKYDGQDNFGFQFRSVDRRVSDQMASLLDDARTFLNRPTWVEPNQAAWLARYREDETDNSVMRSLWHREGVHRSDSEGAPPIIREQLMDDDELRDEIEETGVDLFEAQILTYDWARDPLFFGDEVAIESVRRCQERAFGRFAAARKYRLEFTQDFLRCAGIYERVRRRLRAADQVGVDAWGVHSSLGGRLWRPPKFGWTPQAR